MDAEETEDAEPGVGSELVAFRWAFPAEVRLKADFSNDSWRDIRAPALGVVGTDIVCWRTKEGREEVEAEEEVVFGLFGPPPLPPPPFSALLIFSRTFDLMKEMPFELKAFSCVRFWLRNFEVTFVRSERLLISAVVLITSGRIGTGL